MGRERRDGGRDGEWRVVVRPPAFGLSVCADVAAAAASVFRREAWTLVGRFL